MRAFAPVLSASAAAFATSGPGADRPRAAATGLTRFDDRLGLDPWDRYPQTARHAGSPYGFVGDGRLSRHWRHYFSSLGIPWKLWSRRLARPNGKPGLAAAEALAGCPTILLAVSDDAIAPVMARLRAEGLDDRRYRAFLRRPDLRRRLRHASAHELRADALRAGVLPRHPGVRGPRCRAPGSGRRVPRAVPAPAESLLPAEVGRQGLLPRALRAGGRLHRGPVARFLHRDGGALRRAARSSRRLSPPHRRERDRLE